MKWAAPLFVLFAFLSISAHGLEQTVPCSKQFPQGDVVLEAGQCIKTESGWTVRLESAFYNPSSAVFKLFNPQGAAVTEKTVATQSETRALVQEAAIELLDVKRPQLTPQVSARIQSWTYLAGGDSLQDFPQPKKPIAAANLKDEFSFPDGSQAILDAYKDNRLFFLLKEGNTAKSVELSTGQRFVDDAVQLQFFGTRDTVGGKTEFQVGLNGLQKKQTVPAEPSPTPTPTVKAKPSLAPSATPQSTPRPTTAPTATPKPPSGLEALLESILSFFRSLLGG